VLVGAAVSLVAAITVVFVVINNARKKQKVMAAAAADRATIKADMRTCRMCGDQVDISNEDQKAMHNFNVADKGKRCVTVTVLDDERTIEYRGVRYRLNPQLINDDGSRMFTRVGHYALMDDHGHGPDANGTYPAWMEGLKANNRDLSPHLLFLCDSSGEDFMLFNIWNIAHDQAKHPTRRVFVEVAAENEEESSEDEEANEEESSEDEEANEEESSEDDQADEDEDEEAAMDEN